MNKRVISNNLFAIKWIFKISPGYAITIIFSQIIDDVCVSLEHTYLVAYIISCIQNNRSFSDVLIFFIPLTAVTIICLIASPFIDSYLIPKTNEKINKEIKLLLYRKSAKIDVSKYDDPQFYNDFIWAMQEAPGHIIGALNSFSIILSVIITMFIVGSYMIYADAIGLIFVFVTVVITFALKIKQNTKRMKLQEEVIPLRRKRDYVNRIFYLSDYVKDIKASNMGDVLYKDFIQASDEIEKVTVRRGKTLLIIEYLSSVFQKIITFDGLYLSYLLYQSFVLNLFSFGTLVALYNSSSKLKSNIDSFSNIIPEFHQHSIYIEKMRTFLDSKNELIDRSNFILPDSGSITMNNVSFSYPGSSILALDKISMQINPGDKIALVGYNGAGKSTLVKLLMRFYDPSIGTVLYGANSLSEYSISDYRKKFGTVFQDYEIFATTLGQNITMSDVEINRDKAIEIFTKTDFMGKYNTLTYGFETQITKEFDDHGINLSGGETQKVALSRVLYSDASILIFDEPSSALDPIAEYQLNQTILDIARNKTVIIITHRLSTTKFVDKIYMMENGKIIESGSHDQLINKNGKYAEMYNLQASKYR